MTTTAGPRGAGDATAPRAAPASPALGRADGVELLGALQGSGYKEGAALVRRRDGQMVQLGPLMYALLECVDGRRDERELAHALSQRIGRRVRERHVARIAQKLAQQGLLAGTEDKAPPRRNPLLALRWKVLVTNPAVTKRLTAPFTVLFRPWLMWPIVACFCGVFWFVLFHKGVASATAQAFDNPGLLLVVFVLAIASAAFHELGHAAACRYGGATPGGMGAGLYLVWPAFYTDVTDAYRLPRRARLRVDLGGLYFNAVVAVVTMAVWLGWHVDALLLLVALQVLQMVKQLSPVIRSDGYHILADATGVPDLYAHMGPTLRRLLPGRDREPSALTGWARLLVTVWVLVVVPVLLSLGIGAVLVLPKLAASAWDSGRHIVEAVPHQAADGQIIQLLASLVRMLALLLPVVGSVLVTQKIVRTTVGKARGWSRGRPARQAVAGLAAAVAVAGIAWAWWPAGQYRPVRATDQGTVPSLVSLISDPGRQARPCCIEAAKVRLAPGKHLAVAMIPVGGATRQHPAVFILPGSKASPGVAILSNSSPDPARADGGASVPAPTRSGAPAVSSSTAAPPTAAAAFPFALLKAPGKGGTQALAENTKDGGVTYDIAYALVTVTGGAPATETNSAYALAHCRGCTTVAVSFQVILVVGQSNVIAPVNAAGALNYDCAVCITTAIADQVVVTLKSVPSPALVARLQADLRQLNALPALGAGGSPTAIAATIAAVQHEIETQLASSGLTTSPPTTTTSSSAAPAGPSSAQTAPDQPSSSAPAQGQAPASASPSGGSPPSNTTTSPDSSSTTTATTPSAQTSTSSGPGSSTTTTPAP